MAMLGTSFLAHPTIRILLAGVAVLVPLLSCSPGPTVPGAGGEANPWTWSNPRLFGYDLNGVYAATRHEVWAVGEHGTVIRFDGWQSQIVPVGTTADLYAIHGTSRDNIFAVGNDVILHFDGTYWRSMGADGHSLRGVHFRGPADVVAVGDQVILRYDGIQWREMVACPYHLKAVIASQMTGDWIFAVGQGVAAAYDGFSWHFATLPAGTLLNCLMFSPWGDSTVIAGGQQDGKGVLYAGQAGYQVSWVRMRGELPGPVGAIATAPFGSIEIAMPGRLTDLYHLNGPDQWADPTRSVRALTTWYDTDATALRFAVGTSGTMLLGRRQEQPPGISWESFYAGPGLAPVDLVRIGCDRIYGASGNRIMMWDGNTWSSVPAGTEQPLADIWVDSSGAIFGVSSGGLIVRGDASGMTQVPSGTAESLQSIWGSALDDVWATLYGGMLHFNGSTWSLSDPGLRSLGTVVRGRTRDDVYIAAETGTVMHWDGSVWRTVLADPAVSFGTLCVVPDSPVVLAGGGADLDSNGRVYRYDGKCWKVLTGTGTIPWVHSLLELGPDDVFAGTADGLWHYDGLAWSRDPNLGSEMTWGLCGTRACGLFVATRYGIMHRDLN